MDIPKLETVKRSREYNSYDDELKDKIVYNWLFSDKYTHRDLDEIILKLDKEYSHGYQSMGVLHHLGLKAQHKAIFQGMTIETALDFLVKNDEVHFQEIINCLRRYSGQVIEKRIVDSWEILNDNVALQTVDKSVFLHRGTGIPMGTRKFFEIEDMLRGQRKDIRLKYRNVFYEAHFDMENKEKLSSRLFWTSEFRDLLEQELPAYYEIFEKDLDVGDIQFPKIRFYKLDPSTFEVELIEFNEIELDMDSEDAEEASNPAEASGEKRKEGKVTYFYSKKYERSSKNKVDAIAYHGCKCTVCGFDYEEHYGLRGRGYIEVHHKNPLSTVGEEVTIDPKTDLVPVCANCHRMIHRRKNEVLSIEQMKEIVNKYKK